MQRLEVSRRRLFLRQVAAVDSVAVDFAAAAVGAAEPIPK
jgi:hypothetical protein